jgi:hypothetical protein
MWQDLNNLPLYIAQFFMLMGEAKELTFYA